jgi:predicted dehydrogenase
MGITIVLAGIGGYGKFYARPLLAEAGEHGARLVAGIDPAPEGSPFYEDFRRAGIPIYPSLESFYRADTADLAIISTAIHLHAPLTCLALAHGSYVLCEKPLCASLEDAHRMAEAERQAGKFVAIGYQWSFSAAIQALKRAILEGAFGRPVRLKTKVFWPRPVSYYHRNTWAGQIQAAEGSLVLDSPAHNATAHYLHNMLYLLGDQLSTSAAIADVQAEKYRANEIQNYDAAALRLHTRAGAEILFYTAHSVANLVNPTARYEFEKAVVEYPAGEGTAFVARFHDGSTRSFGNPFAGETNKLWQSVEAARNGVRSGGELACGIQAALPQLLCIHAAQASGEITPLPPHLVRRTDLGGEDTLVWAEGLQEAFERGYEENRLPTGLGTVPWARAGRVVEVEEARG